MQAYDSGQYTTQTNEALEEDNANLEWGLSNCGNCHEDAIRENIELKFQIEALVEKMKLLKQVRRQQSPHGSASAESSSLESSSLESSSQ